MEKLKSPEVWPKSWDITKLLGPAKWTYFHLYVILDIFSRYAVGWMVANRESAVLAKKLISEICERQNIGKKQLTIHADRGTFMKSKPVALLMFRRVSQKPTAGRIPAMTTRTQRPSSKPLNTDPTLRTASAASRTRRKSGVFPYCFLLKALKGGNRDLVSIYELRPLLEDVAKALNVEQGPNINQDLKMFNGRLDHSKIPKLKTLSVNIYNK